VESDGSHVGSEGDGVHGGGGLEGMGPSELIAC
jgi:hypothetical protein